MIRILIAEDHPVVRAGLRELLGGTADIEVVASVADGEEAVTLVDQVEPDVVLMDVSMPAMDGIEATRRITRTNPGTHVVMLTSFSDRKSILAALDAGAIGFLLKDAEPDEIFRGVRAAARGESPLAPKAARAVLSARAGGKGEAAAVDPPDLTSRELEVLALVAAGIPNKLIAGRLGISEKTVKAHLTSVYRAIDVTTRTEAALWARECGLADSEGV